MCLREWAAGLCSRSSVVSVEAFRPCREPAPARDRWLGRGCMAARGMLANKVADGCPYGFSCRYVPFGRLKRPFRGVETGRSRWPDGTFRNLLAARLPYGEGESLCLVWRSQAGRRYFRCRLSSPVQAPIPGSCTRFHGKSHSVSAGVAPSSGVARRLPRVRPTGGEAASPQPGALCPRAFCQAPSVDVAAVAVSTRWLGYVTLVFQNDVKV